MWPGAGMRPDNGYEPEMREVGAEAFKRARVFADAWEMTVGVCGNLREPENPEPAGRRAFHAR